jgi:hypothetical protein
MDFRNIINKKDVKFKNKKKKFKCLSVYKFDVLKKKNKINEVEMYFLSINDKDTIKKRLDKTILLLLIYFK